MSSNNPYHVLASTSQTPSSVASPPRINPASTALRLSNIQFGSFTSDPFPARRYTSWADEKQEEVDAEEAAAAAAAAAAAKEKTKLETMKLDSKDEDGWETIGKLRRACPLVESKVPEPEDTHEDEAEKQAVPGASSEGDNDGESADEMESLDAGGILDNYEVSEEEVTEETAPTALIEKNTTVDEANTAAISEPELADAASPSSEPAGDASAPVQTAAIEQTPEDLQSPASDDEGIQYTEIVDMITVETRDTTSAADSWDEFISRTPEVWTAEAVATAAQASSPSPAGILLYAAAAAASCIEAREATTHDNPGSAFLPLQEVNEQKVTESKDTREDQTLAVLSSPATIAKLPFSPLQETERAADDNSIAIPEAEVPNTPTTSTKTPAKSKKKSGSQQLKQNNDGKKVDTAATESLSSSDTAIDCAATPAGSTEDPQQVESALGEHEIHEIRLELAKKIEILASSVDVCQHMVTSLAENIREAISSPVQPVEEPMPKFATDSEAITGATPVSDTETSSIAVKAKDVQLQITDFFKQSRMTAEKSKSSIASSLNPAAAAFTFGVGEDVQNSKSHKTAVVAPEPATEDLQHCPEPTSPDPVHTEGAHGPMTEAQEAEQESIQEPDSGTIITTPQKSTTPVDDTELADNNNVLPKPLIEDQESVIARKQKNLRRREKRKAAKQAESVAANNEKKDKGSESMDGLQEGVAGATKLSPPIKEPVAGSEKKVKKPKRSGAQRRKATKGLVSTTVIQIGGYNIPWFIALALVIFFVCIVTCVVYCFLDN